MKVKIKLNTGIQNLSLTLLDELLDELEVADLSKLLKNNEELELYEACFYIKLKINKYHESIN